MKFTGGGGWCTVGGSRSDLMNILALATFLQSILYLIGARGALLICIVQCCHCLTTVGSTSWRCFGWENAFEQSFNAYYFLIIRWNPNLFSNPEYHGHRLASSKACGNNTSLQTFHQVPVLSRFLVKKVCNDVWFRCIVFFHLVPAEDPGYYKRTISLCPSGKSALQLETSAW